MNSSACSTTARCRAPLDHVQPRARDLAGDRLAAPPAGRRDRRRRRRPAPACGCRRGGPRRSWPPIASAHDGVALGRRRDQHRAQPLAHRGRRLRRQPALERRRRRPPRRPRRARSPPAPPMSPAGRTAAACSTSASRSSRSGARSASVMPTAPPSDSPTNVDALDAELVEQLQHVVGQLVDRVRAGRRRRAAVAAVVVAQHAELVAEGRRLGVPHLERRAERAREHDDGRLLGALERRSWFIRAPVRGRSARRRVPWSSVAGRTRFCAIRPGSTSGPRAPRAATMRRRRCRPARYDSAPHSLCHAPAARSCSPAIASSSTPTAPRTDRAAARARIAPTGFCLCGIADEPPRPPSLDSATSPTSVCASSTTSSATFSHAPAATASAAPSSATGCGRRATAARRRRARAARRSGRDQARRRAPTGPPSCAGKLARAAGAGARRGDAAQPAGGLEPEGDRQRLLHQRAAGHHACSRCSSASRAHAATTPSSSARISARARRATSIAAVSRMSWLVAPWCASGARSRSARGERDDRVRRASRAADLVRARGTPRRPPRRPRARSRPRRPGAAASAASASSMAASHASSLTAAASVVGHEDGVKRQGMRSGARPAGGCRRPAHRRAAARSGSTAAPRPRSRTSSGSAALASASSGK